MNAAQPRRAEFGENSAKACQSKSTKERRKAADDKKIQMSKFIEKHPILWEIGKFLIVGGGATVIDYLTMALVLFLFAPDKYPSFVSLFVGDYVPTTEATVTGTMAGFVAGLVFNYIFSLLFVFNGTDTSGAKSGKGFLIFTALSAVGLIIHASGMQVFNGYLGWNEWIVKTFLSALVLAFNYLSRKYLLFNKVKADDAPAEEPPLPPKE